MLFVGNDINKNVLDSINVGNKVQCYKGWEEPMDVIGVNDKFIILYDKNTKEHSIMEKFPIDFNYNAYKKGDFRFGACNLIFGLNQDLSTEEGIKNTLAFLNSGDIEVSQRNALPLKYLVIE